MKRSVIVFLCLLGFAAAAVAQPKAVGVRIGYGIDLSYEHNLGGLNFLEAEFGLDGLNGNAVHVDGVYNFMIAEPDWGTSGSWGFYGGPGASVAIFSGDESSAVYAGIVGNLGLEYTFSFPLQLSLDVRPRLMFGNGGIWANGILSLGLGVRYAF